MTRGCKCFFFFKPWVLQWHLAGNDFAVELNDIWLVPGTTHTEMKSDWERCAPVLMWSVYSSAFMCFISKEISNWHFKCQISTWHLTRRDDVIISGDVINRKHAAGVKCASVLSFKWLFHLRDLVIRSSAEPHTVLHRLSLPHRRSN